jgi:hypothetical protein
MGETRLYHIDGINTLLEVWTAAPEPWNGVVISTTNTPSAPVEEVAEATVDAGQSAEVEQSTETEQPSEEASGPEASEPEPEVIPEPSYAEMGYADRELADRRLTEDLAGRLDAIERKAIGIVALFNGDRQMRDPRVQAMLDGLKEIAEMAAKGHEPVSTLVDHIDVLKGEASPSMSVEEIAACYVDTPTEKGREIAPMIDIQSLWLRRKDGTTVNMFTRQTDTHATLH